MKIISFDTETTGTFNQEVLQFSALEINSENNSITRKVVINALPPDGVNILPCAIAVHGLTKEKLNSLQALQYKDALIKIHDYLMSFKDDSDVLVIGYNFIKFDIYNLNINFELAGLTKFENTSCKLLDIMDLSKKCISVNDSGDYKLDSIYITLCNGDNSKIQNHLKNRETHSALYDSLATYKVFVKILNMLKLSISSILDYMIKHKLIEIMTFGKYKGMNIEELVNTDPNYCRWVLSNKDLSIKNPDICYTFKCLFKKDLDRTIILNNQMKK